MRALEGLKVADFSGHASGPICSMLLGDFGADVIKIEPPSGDKARKWGHARYGEKQDISSEFVALNRNKNSIVIDLKNPEGLELARQIIKKCDVVLENMKPGVMERLGLGYEAVSKLKPEIVYCSLSAFGQTGPLSRRPGFDLLMQALCGPLSVTGEPGRPTSRIGPSAIDVLTGAHGVVGILVALRERDHSGRGQLVDTSLYESAIHLMSHMIADYTGTGVPSGKWGPYFPFIAPYGIFMAQDREFYIGCSTDQMFTRFCNAIQRPELLEDPRFLTTGDRAKNQRQLYDILEPLFRAAPAQSWVDLAESLTIPTSLIRDLTEVVKQEQALAREIVVPVEGLSPVKIAGLPIKLSRTPADIRKPPPTLGADTDDVLRRLGFADSEVARLKAARAVR